MNLKLTPPEDDDEIDITPMIDCVFLLVLFFMVTSSFIDEPTKTRSFSITLPRAEDALARPDDRSDTLNLSLEGDFFIRDGTTDEKIESLDEVLRRLKQRDTSDDSRPIRFRCDALIEQGHEVKADEARAFKVSLPRADEATSIPRDQADSLTVTFEGQYYFREGAGQQQSVEDLEVLRKRLENRPEAARKRPVILRCDARCPYQQSVHAKNALKLAGVETIFEEVEVRRGTGKP